MKFKHVITTAALAAAFTLAGCDTKGTDEAFVHNFDMEYASMNTTFGVMEQTEEAGFVMTALSQVINLQQDDFNELLIAQLRGEPDVIFNPFEVPESKEDAQRIMQEKAEVIENFINEFELPEELDIMPATGPMPNPVIRAGENMLEFNLFTKAITVTLDEVQELLDLTFDESADIFDELSELTEHLTDDTQFQLNVLYKGLETPEEMTNEEREAYKAKRELLPEGQHVFIGYSLDIVDTILLPKDVELAYFDEVVGEESLLTLMSSFVVQYAVASEDTNGDVADDVNGDVEVDDVEDLDKGAENLDESTEDLDESNE